MKFVGKIFTAIFLALLVVPINAFGDTFADMQKRMEQERADFLKKTQDDQEKFLEKGCGVSAGMAAQSMWDKGSATNDNKYKQAVKQDSGTLQKYKTKLTNVLNGSESNKVSNAKCTAQSCEYSCNGIHTVCKNGELLKNCGPSVYKCAQNIYIRNEYAIYMIKKVCPDIPERAESIQVFDADISKILVPKSSSNPPKDSQPSQRRQSDSNTTKSPAQKAGNTKRQTATQPQVVKSEVATLPKNASTNSDPVYYQEESEVVKPEVATLPKEANINSAPVYYNGGATNNAEYAEQLREDWEVVEAEEPIQPVSTDSNFDFMEQQRKDRSSTTSALSAQPKEQPKTATAPKPKATINDQASTAPESVRRAKQEILASVGNIKIGDSITYNDSDYKKYLEPAINEWKTACAGIVAATYPNAVSDPESAPAGNGKSKMTCYIKSCGSNDFKLSNNRKSCEKTQEKKKADREAEKNQKAIDKQLEKNQKQSDEIKKIISEIESASKNVTIGSSVNVPTKFFDQNEQVTDDHIDTAFSIWEQRCDKIRTTEITSTTIKEEKIINNYKFTCIVQTCDEKKGLKPSNDGKSCVKTDAQKKADREAEKQAKKDQREEEKEQKEEEKAEKDLQKALEKIQNTPATIGAKISFHADIADKDEIRQAFSDWREACKKNTSEGALEIDTDTKGSTTEKRVKTCLIIKCDEDNGYEVADNGKSCKKTKEQKKREKQEAKEEKQRKKEEQREEDEQVAIENSDENWDESDDEDVTEFKNMIAKITAAFDAATKDKKEEYCKSKGKK